MGEQINQAAQAERAQAAACLQDFFHKQVAEAMPKAIRAQLEDALALGHWLHRATLRIKPGLFGPLDAADVSMLESLSTSTLLVLLFDQRQPAEIIVAARNALLSRYLSDEDVQALAIATANVMARRAVQALAQQPCLNRVQAFTRAESQSLYGDEHNVPGVSPVVLTREQLAAVDDTAGVQS